MRTAKEILIEKYDKYDVCYNLEDNEEHIHRYIDDKENAVIATLEAMEKYAEQFKHNF
jgi:hypothetical protein